MQHEHTEHVAAPPEAVYAAIADVSNLPSFVPQMTAAREAGDGKVEVDARYEGHEQHGEASFNRDDAARRIEWSAGSGYRGWMQVDEDGDGSRLTLFLDTPHPSVSDQDVAATLEAIRMLVESRV
jgi:carbon monoxide dehydrogenase subunit G